jgi:hypothetical protein
MHLVHKFDYFNTGFGKFRSGNYEYKLEKGRLTSSNDFIAYKADGDKRKDEMVRMPGIPGGESPTSHLRKDGPFR